MATSLRNRAVVRLMAWPRAYVWARRLVVLTRYIARRPHEVDFSAFADSPRDGLFLDVGANAGMSALSFRIFNSTMPVLSIEANPHHEPDLRFLTRVLRRFGYRIVAAGAGSGTLRLRVPVYRGVALTGEASVLDERTGDLAWWATEHLGSADTSVFTFSEVQVPAVPLDELEVDPTIIKIDVEGFELDVLHGLERTISRCRPLLLMETPSDISAVSAFLSQWGYRPCRFDAGSRTLVPRDQHGVNVFYLAEDSATTSWLAVRD